MSMKIVLKKLICLIMVPALFCGTFACGTERVNEEYDIIYTGDTKADNFVLLFNTLGYEQLSTKKAFVRSVEYVDPKKIGKNSLWTLLDENDEIVQQGSLKYSGLSYGVQMWEADFSSIEKQGNYRLFAELTNKSGEPFYQEMSLTFRIQNRIYTNNILLPLTIYNAQAREATPEEGGGFYDCNIQMGEAYSHGIFLNGLVQTYVYRLSVLSQEEKDAFIKYSNTAFDYLIHLHDDETGEIKHSDLSRPNADVNLGLHNTIEALYGITAYLYYFSDIDTRRAGQENYERAVKSLEYILANPGIEGAESSYPYDEYLMPIYFYLYQFSEDEKWLNLGVEKLNSFLDEVDLKSMSRHGSRGIPLFEGLYLFAKHLTDHPERQKWIDKAIEIKNKYYSDDEISNAFKILPISESFMADTEWEHMWKMPLGEQENGWQVNTYRAISAIDACFLAELTGDESLEKVATGELGYIMGLNPGLPGELVKNPSTEKTMVAASFVHNLNARYVNAWSRWDFVPKNENFMSIMNGFEIQNKNYQFDDDPVSGWYNGETFIKHDGAFAYAFCVYENLINK